MIIVTDFSSNTFICEFQLALTQLSAIGSLKIAPSFGQLLGCFLIFLSVSYTVYIGPDKEMNEMT